MGRIILLNIKRMAGNKLLLLVLTLAPLLLLSVFGSVVAPVFFSGGLEKARIAVLNEDTDPLTGSIIEGLIEDEKTRGMLEVVFVSSREEGLRLLKSGAAAFISVPAGFQETLRGGGKSYLQLAMNPSRQLESMLISDVLESDVGMVNDAQRAVNSLYQALLADGMPKDQAGDAYYSAARHFMVQALNRKAVIDVQGELSPLGSLMPVEYYASALLAVFLFFSAMAVAGLTAQDGANCVLDRHLAGGRSSASYIATRTVSGAALIALQGIPAVGLILLAYSSGFWYTGAPALALPALLLLAFTVSVFGVCVGILCRGRDVAVKVVFLLVSVLATLGGAVIPASGLGPLADIAPWTPVYAALRLLSSSIFFFSGPEFLESAVVLLVYSILFFAVSYAMTRKKAWG